MDTRNDATATFVPMRRPRRDDPRAIARRVLEQPRRQRRAVRLNRLSVLATIGRTV